MYRFSNPSNEKEYIDVFFNMNDIKEYIKNGKKWNREYFIPNTSIDTICDPFSPKDFVKSTNKKGTLGSIWEKSAELSEKRKDSNGGIDPVKEKTYSDYKKRVGKPHAAQIKEQTAKKLKNLGVSFE